MQALQKTTSQSLSQIGENILIETQTVDYETRINRDRPACFVFLIDQSGSMKDNWGGGRGSGLGNWYRKIFKFGTKYIESV
jgi:hypothetical protein